jgi:hypothetical protein
MNGGSALCGIGDGGTAGWDGCAVGLSMKILLIAADPGFNQDVDGLRNRKIDGSGRVGQAPEGGASGSAESAVGLCWRLFRYSRTQCSTMMYIYCSGPGKIASI